MPKTLTGKVVLVTGASRGIGKGVALELASRGAMVYITARSIDRKHQVDEKYGFQPVGTAQEVVDEINAAGGRALAIKCDHSDDEQVRNVIRQIEAAEGKLDVLVNNAMASEVAVPGMGPYFGGKPFWEVSLDIWDKMMDVGLRSHFATTVIAMPLLLQSKGLVVNISSAGGESYYHSVMYGVEKGGADRMIRDMAVEVGKNSVTFISLWPGFVKTERANLEGWREHVLKRYRLGTQRVRELIAKRTGQPIEEPTIDSMQIESQRFPGMAIAALAADPDVNRLTGRVLGTSTIAAMYGYTDADGKIHDGFGFLKDVWTSLVE